MATKETTAPPDESGPVVDAAPLLSPAERERVREAVENIAIRHAASAVLEGDGAAPRPPRISLLHRADAAAVPDPEDGTSGVVLLAQRLAHFGLEQVVTEDDGNCQFRALAQQLIGDAGAHGRVRRACVEYLLVHYDHVSLLFEDDAAVQRYLLAMARKGTWGDELTLQAAGNAFGCRVHVVSAERGGYYACYEPDDPGSDGAPREGGKGAAVDDVFLAFVAPVQYSSLRPAPQDKGPSADAPADAGGRRAGPGPGPEDGETATGWDVRAHTLMSADERARVKEIFGNYFKINTRFLLNVSQLSFKMKRKLQQARDNIAARNGNDDDDTSNGRESSIMVPGRGSVQGQDSLHISFTEYDQQDSTEHSSRVEKIHEGCLLLRQRLTHLKLAQVPIEDDGNCQFRAVAHQLFGDADQHANVRFCCVEHMRAHEAGYSLYFDGDDEWQRYLDTMARDGTWGDELTLRAACGVFGCEVHVMTSERENYYLRYDEVENHATAAEAVQDIFLAYISPVHYNSICLAEQQ